MLAIVRSMHPRIISRYSYDETYVIPKNYPKPLTIAVENRDAIEVGLSVNNPLVMILADAHVPGGCILSGNNMQEESLFRPRCLLIYNHNIIRFLKTKPYMPKM